MRDAEAWVSGAVKSILCQTYSRLELIVIDNNSVDQSRSVVERITDPRIVLLSQPVGNIVSALNYGLSHARGEVIARQDADDYSEPERIAAQVKLLSLRQDLGLVGCSFKKISLNGELLSTQKAVTDPAEIRKHLTHAIPFPGPSIVGHRRLFDLLGGYDYAFENIICEDHDLLVRAAELANLSAAEESLYIYRTNNPLSMCGRINYQYAEGKALVRSRAIARNSILFNGHIK
jgi:glycosyltransferase involved in cell wall biosynthesis